MGTRQLQVRLNDLPVGTLSLGDDERCEFRLLPSYRQAFPRPVLGQRFMDDLDGVWRSRSRVPAWFSNLLPEGQLREWIARQVGVHVDREFFLLQRLGADLPGAVRIVAEDSQTDTASDEPDSSDQVPGESEWHFSLAGVQLKFSARRQGRGLTIPVHGKDGDWLVKLPDVRFPRVPENEHATMRWAGLCGVEVPEIALVPIEDIQGLPTDVAISLREPMAYAVRRFDRLSGANRIHMEDFAQLLGLYPELKYDKYNYETIGSVVNALTGEVGVRQYLRRMVFMVASGNGDAHHKNWSLLYPDGIRAVLSPAYDLVCTVAYRPDDRLALNLARSKAWADVKLESFARLARKLDINEETVMQEVRASVAAVRDAWSRHQHELGYDTAVRQLLDKHMAGIPLMRM